MSERAPLSPEHKPSSDHELKKHEQEILRDKFEQGEKARHEHAEKIEALRKEAEKAAERAKDTLDRHKAENEKPASDHPFFVNRELKSIAYQRTLKRARSRMSLPARTFSRLIHNSTVESVSEVAGKTVARPSGILVGGIVAFVGSSIFLWVSKHYGYEYNFLLFALLFVGGFVLGLLIELLWRLLKKLLNK